MEAGRRGIFGPHVVKRAFRMHRSVFAFLPLVLAACGGSTTTEPAPPDLSIKEGSIPLEAPVRDIAYDAKRNLLYLAEPSFSQIGILSLASLQNGSPIPTGPNRPTGLDLSAGQDSLIVSLPEAKAIGIINLTGSTRVFDTVRLSLDNFLNRRPDLLRVMAGSRVIIAVTFDGSGFGGEVVEYNLATRTQRVRTDVGINQNVTELTRLARSMDRQRMLLLIDDSCCPLSGFVYNATTDQWSSRFDTVNRFFPSVASNSDGSRFLIGATLFSGTLTFLQTYSPAGYNDGPTALASDGTTAFFATPGGVLQVRLADGGTIRTMSTSGAPTRLYVLPNGKAVVVLTATTVQVFRL
jgi:hypothetical protein